MNVTREVILDLMPVYLAGDASPDTRRLVEEYLRQDPELRMQMPESFPDVPPASLPPDLELRALRRTRGLLGRQRWLFGAALLFTLLPFASDFRIENGRLAEARFYGPDHPILAILSLIIGLACWTAYYLIRRRLRTAI
jgi:hypothetical protein